jgi:SAM-dependent methyltransferase
VNLPTSADFDSAYAQRSDSPGMRRVFAQVAPDLPPYVEPFSFVNPALLSTLLDALALTPGDHLVDLACGRGGPGWWLASSSGARLTGVDFSPVALAHAAGRFPDARFVVGTLTASGLRGSCADGVMCVDAMQFASDLVAGAREAYRILRPGGRFAMSNWAPRVQGDPQLGERVRNRDWGQILTDAGFEEVRVEVRSDWHELYTALYRTALDQGDPGDDAGLAGMQAEARARLPLADRLDRVLVAGTRPRLG